MNHRKRNSQLKIMAAARAAKWTIRGALLAAVCGALYGLLFAGLAALLQGDPGRIAATSFYFALCGVAAGVLVGGFGAAVCDVEAEFDNSVPAAVGTQSPQIAAAGDIEAVRWRRPVNRLAELPAVNRRRVELASSKKPSWN